MTDKPTTAPPEPGVEAESKIPIDEVATAGPGLSALEQLNSLFSQLMERYPEKGLGTSSMGKFDPIRRWLADELGLADWSRQTYAVGSSTAAHNFNSRWVQNNLISGSRAPLGAAFLSAPADSNESKLLASAMNANEHFVDGSRPTSFEAIITFIQRPGEHSVTPYAIQSVQESGIAKKLVDLFPSTPLTVVEWKGGGQSAGMIAVPTKVEAVPLSPEMLTKLGETFEEANYQAAEDLPGRVISSLAAKPFLLLAGLSGTGKTLLALALSRWLAVDADQVLLVAVGADWTTTHHLIGYPDALASERYVRTPALDLLLQANKHPELPHFLILDEMNLSHVERYFSDFLSAMESHEDITLHAGPVERDGVPPRLSIPRNLFVIGTINVDETTYMFSPKVIDRANVIEFTVNSTAMETFLSGDADFSPAAIGGLGSGFGAALADVSGGSAGLEDLDEALAKDFRAGLLGLFQILDRAGLQFGFRTVREMIRFLVVHRQLHGATWSARGALDSQLVQRLLPRLSGESAKLKPVLIALLSFCLSWEPGKGTAPDLATMTDLSVNLSQLDDEAVRSRCSELSASYPLTSDKIARMFKRLSEHGFATAIEA